tara:strand:+ start:57204 stop:57971 length:768 start_codon:yes stop_codon:yes gene_type:complete
MLMYKNIKDFIHSFYYPKGQYFLISFPKTGRTWLNYMIKQMLESASFLNKNNHQFIYNEHDTSEVIIENGFRNDPKELFEYNGRNRYRRGRVIFLVRDPRDVIVSHYYQITQRSKNPFKFNSLSDFVKDEIIGFNRIIYFYNLWHSKREIPIEFKLVKYEDLVLDGVNTLEKISDFLNLDIHIKDLKKIYLMSSAEKMREKELNKKLDGSNYFGSSLKQLKVRRAKIGSFIDELSDDDIEYCNNKIKNLNPYFNY